MKNFNFTLKNYIEALKKDLFEVVLKYQESSKDGHFNSTHKINLRYERYDYRAGDLVNIKNRALNGYLKYNTHIRYNKDDSIFISDEFYQSLLEIAKKYHIENIGTTGLICVLSKSILQEILNKDNYLRDIILGGYNISYSIKKEIYKIQYKAHLEKLLTSKQESKTRKGGKI